MRALALVLALGFAPAALALDPERLPSQYLVAAWQDELPQSSVQAIFQDHQGYLWVGTQNGLARFDGLEFEVFDPAAEPGLPSSDILRLIEDHEGRLWVATRGGGLAFRQGDHFESWQDGDASELAKVALSLAIDPGGRLWVGTRSHGVVAITGTRAIVRADSWGLPPNSTVLSLAVDAAGAVWAGLLEGGLWRLEGERFQAVPPAGLPVDSVAAMAFDPQGRLWIGTGRKGVFRRDHPEAGPTEAIPDTTGSTFALLSDRSGTLWAASYNRGLLRLSPGPVAALTRREGLSLDAVTTLFEDREGNLWVGTDGGGLDRLRDGVFRSFGPPEGMATGQVRSVLEDHRGRVWIGTEGGGLAYLEAGLGSVSRLAELGPAAITSLAEAPDGALWVGVRNRGLLRWQEGQASWFGRESGLITETVLTLYFDHRGTLWVATNGAGLFRQSSPGRFEPVASELGLAQDRIWAISEGPSGDLYLGTDGNGLKILHPGPSPTLSQPKGLPSDTVMTLHSDEDGTLWIGTYGGGLARLAPDGRVQSFGRREGLLDDTILGILDDERGALWLSSNKGIFRVPKADLLAFFDGPGSPVTLTAYGKADGMRAAECNGGVQPAGFMGRDGRLWFATIEGVVMVDPNRLPKNLVPPGVVIEDALADGRSIRGAGPLPAGLERLELHYAGLSFSNPTRVAYRYQLEGFDRDWINAGAERRATYTNLPAGRKYRFRVQAVNEDGVWNQVGAGFQFEILPHFYQRPWFLALASLALFLVAWGGYQLRVRQLLHRTRQLETVVAERTAQVVAQRDQLSTANQELTRLNQFKSEFMGIVAHDLKNPLAVIYGYAGLMVSKAEKEPGQAKTARRIGASARRMLSIVSDLLDTTALESGRIPFEPEPVEMAEVLFAVLDSQQMLAQDRDVRLEARVTGETRVLGDREKLRRVLENLVGNAVRYTRPSSTVLVSLEERAEGGRRVERITVADQGPGLTPEEVARLFQRFERLGQKSEGPTGSTGLGLAIVRQFVELHGGRVWVESEPGVGSSFIVELPAEPAP
ncbi:MAG: two-component regulator propeller domain-containing protein [Thermoanaerobaculia bacterium]